MLDFAVRPNKAMATAEYVKPIRQKIPVEAFKPHHGRLYTAGAHLGVLALGYAMIRRLDAPVCWAACSLVLGHSLACLAFIAHEVSHGAVVRNKWLRRALEFPLWGLNLVPPFLWLRLHNHGHHVHPNGPQDPERPFVYEEKSPLATVYMRLFFPNRRTPGRHPFVLLHFVTYILRHLLTALAPGAYKPAIVTFKPLYDSAQRLRVLAETFLILAMQLCVWWLTGESWIRYLFASLLPAAICSCVVMTYVFTNHFLNPFCGTRPDPLAGTTSVIVPRWMNLVHGNFSYHTEPHLFPAMISRYLPIVADLLREHYPERYNRMPLGEAWCRLWKKGEFLDQEDGALV